MTGRHAYRLTPWAAAALVVAVAVAAYASTVNNYFVQDDFGVVWLLSQKPATSFPGWFVSTWMDDIWGFVPDEIRPFPAASYQLAAVFGAGRPLPNHLVNIAFHAGTALLVLATATRAAGIGLPAATFAAVLFALLLNQAETVAWITGRVDSMPALFYVASFVTYVRWRAGAHARLYGWSILWLVVALFSKQNTITLGPALVLYDLVVARRRVAPSWAWLRPYVPYAVVTAGYLLLRYALFGEVARESTLTAASAADFARNAVGHVMRVVVGEDTIRSVGGVALALAATAAAVAWVTGGVRKDADRSTAARTVLYFGLVWTALGLAPTFVSGYVSPRHAYLASMGWAISAGVVVDLLWHARAPRLARVAVGVAAMALLAASSVQLHLGLQDWSSRAAQSRKAVADLEREAAGAPDGTLIVAGVSPRSWAYALPFAAKPPFARTDLTRRVSVIGDASLYCCPAAQWDAATRATIQAWLAHPGRPPVIAMYWNPTTGRLVTLSETNDRSLRAVVALLLQSADQAALDTNIQGLLNQYVAFHAAAARE